MDNADVTAGGATLENDRAVLEAVRAANRCSTIVERASDSEMRSLIIAGTEILDADTDSETTDWKSWMQAWLYGVQIGYDMAVADRGARFGGGA